jgi:hypothetical protein
MGKLDRGRSGLSIQWTDDPPTPSVQNMGYVQLVHSRN